VDTTVLVPEYKKLEVLQSIRVYAYKSQTLDNVLKQLSAHKTRLIVHPNENLFYSTTSGTVEWVGGKERFKLSLDKPSFFAWIDSAGVTILHHAEDTEVVVYDDKRVTVLNKLRSYAIRSTRFSNQNEIPLRTLDRILKQMN